MWVRRRDYDFLRSEYERVVTENRKLLNSILPRLGYDPLDEPKPKESKPVQKKARNWHAWGLKRMAETMKRQMVLQIRDPEVIEDHAPQEKIG